MYQTDVRAQPYQQLIFPHAWMVPWVNSFWQRFQVRAQALRDWISSIELRTANIERVNPTGKVYCEGFKGMLSDKLLKGKIFYSLKEAPIITGQ